MSKTGDLKYLNKGFGLTVFKSCTGLKNQQMNSGD